VKAGIKNWYYWQHPAVKKCKICQTIRLKQMKRWCQRKLKTT